MCFAILLSHSILNLKHLYCHHLTVRQCKFGPGRIARGLTPCGAKNKSILVFPTFDLNVASEMLHYGFEGS